ncbi:phage holin family protein [Nocardioides fonticola]|uniref:Phage holin family protein n=1 Tax=Nocardioides fonticola TaxID=450363 RepID=A0ABP7XQ76_9ACTN
MDRILTRLATTAVSLAVAAWLVDGIRFTGPRHGMDEIQHKLLPLLIVAAILGVVTSFVKPVLTVLSIPFIILTLGLFLLVINAAMLGLTGWIAGQLDLGFKVTGFWPAVAGAIIITITTWIVDGFVGDDD